MYKKIKNKKVKHKIIKGQIEYEKNEKCVFINLYKKIIKYKLKFIKYKFQVPI